MDGWRGSAAALLFAVPIPAEGARLPFQPEKRLRLSEDSAASDDNPSFSSRSPYLSYCVVWWLLQLRSGVLLAVMTQLPSLLSRQSYRLDALLPGCSSPGTDQWIKSLDRAKPIWFHPRPR